MRTWRECIEAKNVHRRNLMPHCTARNLYVEAAPRDEWTHSVVRSAPPVEILVVRESEAEVSEYDADLGSIGKEELNGVR